MARFFHAQESMRFPLNGDKQMNERCVVYRTGGTKNFTWHRSIAMTSDEAIQVQRDMARMGYRSHIEHYARSVAIGLPETYEDEVGD